FTHPGPRSRRAPLGGDGGVFLGAHRSVAAALTSRGDSGGPRVTTMRVQCFAIARCTWPSVWIGGVDGQPITPMPEVHMIKRARLPKTAEELLVYSGAEHCELVRGELVV